MSKYQLLLCLFFLSQVAVLGDALTAVVADSQKIIQDPKTKVIYYLESDSRHIAALSPDGKFIWCCEIVPASAPRRVHIISFSFDKNEDRVIDVESNPVGPAYGVIDKRTGHYLLQGED
jgi:hypothetical protein